MLTSQKSTFAADGEDQVIGWHLPRFHWTFILLVLPGVTATDGRSYEGGALIAAGTVETPEGDISPFRVDEPSSHRE